MVDIDQDGDDDFLFGHRDQLNWLENIDGNGQFAPSQVLAATPGGVNRLEVVDVDGDGDEDIVVVGDGGDTYAHRIDWFENRNGASEFSEARSITRWIPWVSSIAPIDLDGDGLLDLLATSVYGDSVGWFRNVDGVGDFTFDEVANRETSDWLSGVRDVRAEDIDGDGDLDLITTGTDATYDIDDRYFNGAIYWHENLGDAREFAPPKTVVRYEQFIPRVSHVADFDSDGDLDILSSSNDHDVIWFRNDGTGQFDLPRVWNSIGKASWIRFQDVNGDGAEEAVFRTATQTGSEYTWANYDPETNQFGPRNFLFAIPQRANFALGRVDADADLDLIVMDGSATWWEQTNADIQFEKRETLLFGGLVDVVPHIGDWDQDGVVEVLRMTQEREAILYDGIGGQIVESTRVSVLGSLLPSVDTTITADLDSDGDLDLIRYNNFGDELQWLENRISEGEGFFGHASLVPREFRDRRQRAVAVADMNDDGHNDLVVVGLRGLRWYPNNGENTFPEERIIDFGSTDSMTLGDFDADGDLDILVGRLDHTLELKRNTGGVFRTAWSIPVREDVIRHPVPVDVDADGDLDVMSIGIDGLGVRVVVYENEGPDRPFRLPQLVGFVLNDVRFPRSAPDFRLGDVNDDGRIDVILDVQYAESNALYWLENITETYVEYGPPREIDRGSPDGFQLGFEVVDLNGDGHDDVVAGWAQLKLVWYETRQVGDANRDGVFDSSDLVRVFAAGAFEQPARSATFDEGDWNGDGVFDTGDLVLAFQTGGYVP